MKFFIILSVLATVSLAQITHYQPGSILDYLQRHRYTRFIQYLDQTGLTATLNGTGNYTLFLPRSYYNFHVDPAIANDTAKLSDLLKYNLVSGVHRQEEFNYNEYRLNTLQGSDIRVNYYFTTRVTALNGKRLYSANHMASNGVIHLVYDLLTPPAGTVLDILAMNSSFSTLYSAVQTVSLDTFLQDQSPITLFAPTNDAFNRLGTDKVKALLANPTLLADILKYHVIPGTLYSVGYHKDYIHTFEEKDTLKIGRYLSSYGVENSQIARTEISATNGVVHAIDEVLIPHSLESQVNAL